MNNKKTPEEIENMGLREFILFVDFMGTKEFCDWQKIPPPHFTGDVKTSSDLFLQVDAIKHKLFVERAKKGRGDGEWVREKDANDTFSKLHNELSELEHELNIVKKERDTLKEDLEISDKAHETTISHADKMAEALKCAQVSVNQELVLELIDLALTSYKQNQK